MSKKAEEKKVHNRYDYYEILAMFTTSTEQYMSKQYTPVRTNFYIKCILGPLLALNAYLSHWGPWKWPSNFYFLIFSIVFFYVGSYIFGILDSVSKSKGSLIGEYIINDSKNKYTISFSDDKLDYILEQFQNGKKDSRKKAFPYPSYFTNEGIFLQNQFHQNLGGFLKSKAK